ncbi:hypothetical protein CALCODRAFT_481399 [Calocera cornea HHB12733]|uniref:F-box domain-containing protein n=1 Tax=Calocera cornea HHB12733 TaxID=1353952 RepID=A0A165HSY7_9BASI|nr:hypothetical protein CALCODRAFT_481399 [Calocera cornea HHB12733]
MGTIDSLPPELLQHVFDAVVDAWEEAPAKRWTELMNFHTNILLVDRTWRTTALHTSSIWRNIPLHRTFINYAEYCLKHSGNQGLNVQASLSGSFRELITEERAARIHSLEVEDKEAYRYWMTMLLQLPINGLHRLSLHSLCSSWEEPLTLLARNRNLRELEITRFFHQPLIPTSSVCRPTLPSLKKLKISDWAQETQSVLSSFSAPALVTLHIAVNDEHRYGQRIRPMTLNEMDTFDAVKEVTFQFAITTEDVLAVLRHTPNVEILRMAHSWRFQPSFDDLLGHLANPNAATVLAPRLQVLGLHEFPVWMPSILAFARARLSRSRTSWSTVEGRVQRVLPMRCVELSERTLLFYPPADVERLQEVCEVIVWEPPAGEIR